MAEREGGDSGTAEVSDLLRMHNGGSGAHAMHRALFRTVAEK